MKTFLTAFEPAADDVGLALLFVTLVALIIYKALELIPGLNKRLDDEDQYIADQVRLWTEGLTKVIEARKKDIENGPADVALTKTALVKLVGKYKIVKL